MLLFPTEIIRTDENENNQNITWMTSSDEHPHIIVELIVFDTLKRMFRGRKKF